MHDDPFARRAFFYRAQVGLFSGRKVRKSRAEFHERMIDHWMEMAHRLGRPGYVEGPGFTNRPGERMVVRGCERPYGPFSRSHWKYVRLVMREAFLAEWHRALGTTYETVEGGRRPVLITGITS